jgi:TolB-like protein/DNA-binding winged helix-turn-helix (wHTH) protein
MHSNGGSESISFGPFELRLKSGELLRDGSLVRLPPQPHKVLSLLAENAGQLVTREEIRRQVWGDETFVDFDKGLNFCIKQIREALGDSAQSPRYIETLPRRGYRFIAPINQAGVARADELQSRKPETAAARKPSRSFNRALLAVALIALAALAYLLWPRRAPQPAAPAAKIMLAVLPFENLNADPSQEYFSTGLTEEMIAQLGRLRPDRLGVIARTTALTYRNSNKDIRQIGEELGVSYVLEGSVRREGDRLRITAQLIQVSDQTHLWSETYERGERDLLEIQNEVAGRVARSLALELLPNSSGSIASRTSRPEAYDEYLKGRYLIYKDTIEDFERSIPHFERAIEIDPQFAPAYAGVCESRVMLATWQNIPAGEVLSKVRPYALKAVELDPSLAESYFALGAVNFWLEWDWREAGANIKRAVELNPSNPNIRLLYANYLLTRGQVEAAAQEVRQALELDPVSLLTNGLSAYFYLRASMFDDAIVQAKRMLELEPNSPAGHDCLITVYRFKGMYEEARAVMRKLIEKTGNNPQPLRELNKGDAKSGIGGLERYRLGRMRDALAKGERVRALSMATTCAEIGETDEALEWLERAFAEREPMFVFFNMHPRYASLRRDPRFNDLARRAGLAP